MRPLAEVHAGKTDDAVNERAVAEVSRWLLGSGIQSRARKAREAGGVAAWYEIAQRRYPFLYSEITGYMITTLMFLYRYRPDRAWLKSAEAAADWLVGHAFHPSGGVRTRYYLVRHYTTPNYSFHAGRLYAFDTAMVGYALIQLYKVQPKVRYWGCITRMHDFLLNHLYSKNSIPYAYLDPESGRGGEDPDKWSDQVGAFHAKIALFHIDFYRMTGHPRHRLEAIRLLDAVLAMQEKNGCFITSRKDQSTHLHPHLYALEGLFYGAYFLRERRYLQAVLKGMRWTKQAISESGSVSAIYEPLATKRGNSGFAHHDRSDIVAQVLRLGSLLEGLDEGRGMVGRFTLRKLRDHLLMFQLSEDGPQNGGFLYGADTDGRLRIHLNAWSSMFALQAIWMYDEFVLKGREISLDSFV